ncbi:hypothetical protein [Anaerosporobacter faecicola]|uniref:hypothetical protein n=1 Tax=Anaerosporobacter faecicola TaxID=2718714 RepID=UPI00143A38EA|nr:hypothetical protein [Anaerosporobacter faecicola]
MFTKSEKKLLGGGYFTIIREEEKFIELQSKNTGHCWMIFKKTYDRDKPVVLYHKHTANTDWYHEHRNTCTVKNAVANIKLHDDYVLKHKEVEKNGI